MALKDEYINRFEEVGLKYPSEWAIRVFKGEYPELSLPKEEYEDSKILDIGVGPGQHLIFFENDLGFNTYGIEISENLVELAEDNCDKAGANPTIKVGENEDIPFKSNQFDYLFSWNSCYYGNGNDFDFIDHVEEYARVTKHNGKIILSIPKKTSFIFNGSQDFADGYKKIKNDPFGVRNGTVIRFFESVGEIQKSFKPYFKNFTVSSVHDYCFGYNYHWWVLVGERANKRVG